MGSGSIDVHISPPIKHIRPLNIAIKPPKLSTKIQRRSSMSKHNNSPVDKPHDKLVRRLLSNPTTARELLEALLPDTVKSLIDLSSLERQPDTFVDRQHRMFEVDILFKAKCNNMSKHMRCC